MALGLMLFLIVLVLCGLPLLLNRLMSGSREKRSVADSVEALFGGMMILVGGLLLLTGGGCTVYIGSVLVSAKGGETFVTLLIVSLVVLLIGIGMIWGGNSMMKHARGDRDPRGPRT